jgi:hypothetical protein
MLSPSQMLAATPAGSLKGAAAISSVLKDHHIARFFNRMVIKQLLVTSKHNFTHHKQHRFLRNLGTHFRNAVSQEPNRAAQMCSFPQQTMILFEGSAQPQG